jgi:GTP cyclohydrolase I
MDEAVVKNCFEALMVNGLGLDIDDPNLKDTPKRVAKMYCQEFFSSLSKEPPVLTIFPNDKDYTGIILLDNIPFVSVCSHHFLPFSGLAWFLYIPDKCLVGASKISRIISYFSAFPQIQEHLTQQIVDNFVANIEPKGCMLVMQATHGCMSCRGIKQSGSLITSVVQGSFAENLTTREEGMELIKLSKRS